jgi:WD40 repeat protein
MISTLTGNSAGPIAGYIATGRTDARRLNVFATRKNALAPSAIASQPTDSNSRVLRVAFESTYLVAATEDAAGLKFFSRSGSTFTAQSVPNNIACDDGDCAISADGLYIVSAGKVLSGGGARIYHNNSGTLTRLTSVGTIENETKACAASSDGKYIALMTSDSPTFLRIKERSNSGVSATYADMVLASQPSSGAGNNSIAGLAFSPNDTYLAVATTTAADMTVYKFNSGTSVYEKLASPWSGTTPTNSLNGCAFDPAGDILAIATGTQTFIYSRSSDTFTYETTLGAGGRGGFHPSGNYYITGAGTIYRKNSASSWTQLTSVTGGNCAAFSPAI